MGPLAKQILDILYTVRNNLVHAGKLIQNADHRKVIDTALPLLIAVVMDFLEPSGTSNSSYGSAECFAGSAYGGTTDRLTSLKLGR